MGGSVEMGAAALRQAALCWWRRYCMTMLLSLLDTGASVPAPRPFRSGGLLIACLIVALQAQSARHTFEILGLLTRSYTYTTPAVKVVMKAIQYRRASATGEGDARSRGPDLVKAGVVQGLACCGVSWGRLLRQGRFSSRGLAGASAGIVAHPGLSSAAAPKRPLGRAGVAASESGVLACGSGSSA